MNLLDYVSKQRGLRSSLARTLGVPFILVSQWALGKRQVPAERCPSIEEATNGMVTCEELRPDINWSILRRSKSL